MSVDWEFGKMLMSGGRELRGSQHRHCFREFGIEVVRRTSEGRMVSMVEKTIVVQY